MIEEREWESIYTAIRQSNGRSEIAEGNVIDHSDDGEHVFVSGFGSEPVAIAALEYSHSIYKGNVKNTIRSEPALPEIGQRVLVARPGGSLHRPRIIGIVREGLEWKQPEDLQVTDLNPNSDFLFGGALEIARADEFAAALKTRDTDQADPKFQLRVDGLMEWGSGAGAFDVKLHRVAAAHLRLDDSRLQIQRDDQLDVALSSHVTSDTESRFFFTAHGAMAWGPGNAAIDTNLYRADVGELKTDDLFFAAGIRTPGVEHSIFGDGITNALMFKSIKHVSGTLNPPSMNAHTGNVANCTLPAGTGVTGDIVICLGMLDPGNRGVHPFAQPHLIANDTVRFWLFNTDSVTLDEGPWTMHFLVINM